MKKDAFYAMAKAYQKIAKAISMASKAIDHAQLMEAWKTMDDAAADLNLAIDILKDMAE